MPATDTPATTIESLRALARLARLSLTDEEVARLAPELGRILSAFEVLGRHDPRSEAAAEPDPSAPRSAPTRGDEPLPSLPRDVLLASAATREGGFFVVPKTVGAES